MTQSEKFKAAWAIAKQAYAIAQAAGEAQELNVHNFFTLALRGDLGDIEDGVPQNPIVDSNDLPLLPYNDYLRRGKIGYKYTNHDGSDTFYNINRGEGRADDDGLDLGAYRSWKDGGDFTVGDAIETFSAALPEGMSYDDDIDRFVRDDDMRAWLAAGWTKEQAVSLESTEESKKK